MHLMMVLFPAPFCPSKIPIWPSGIEKLISLFAITLRYFLVTCETINISFSSYICFDYQTISIIANWAADLF